MSPVGVRGKRGDREMGEGLPQGRESPQLSTAGTNLLMTERPRIEEVGSTRSLEDWKKERRRRGGKKE